MTEVEASLVVDAAPDAVTAVLLDADRIPSWTAGLERFQIVSGTPGEVGFVGRAHFREAGAHLVLEGVLVEAVPGRRYRSELTGEGLAAMVEMALEPVADGQTRVTMRWSVRGTSPVSRAVLPLARRRIEHRVEQDLAALRRVVERSPA